MKFDSRIWTLKQLFVEVQIKISILLLVILENSNIANCLWGKILTFCSKQSTSTTKLWLQNVHGQYRQFFPRQEPVCVTIWQTFDNEFIVTTEALWKQIWWMANFLWPQIVVKESKCNIESEANVRLYWSYEVL